MVKSFLAVVRVVEEYITVIHRTGKFSRGDKKEKHSTARFE